MCPFITPFRRGGRGAHRGPRRSGQWAGLAKPIIGATLMRNYHHKAVLLGRVMTAVSLPYRNSDHRERLTCPWSEHWLMSVVGLPGPVPA